MTQPKDIATLINKWDSIMEFHKDMGCGYEAARQMRNRNSISPVHWENLIKISDAKGIEGVTFEWLLSLKKTPSNSPTGEVA